MQRRRNSADKPIVIGRMKAGKFRYHIQDDVYSVDGICRPLTATDGRHQICILVEILEDDRQDSAARKCDAHKDKGEP